MKFNARLIAIVAAVIILLAAAWWLLYFKKTSETEDNTLSRPGPNDTSQPYRDTVSFPPTPPEAEEVYSYSGTIQSIDLAKSEVIIVTDHGAKLVHVTDATQIVEKRSITREKRMAMSVEERSRITGREEPLPGGIIALTVDTIIEAVSSENIKGASSFGSSKIIVLN